MLTVQKAVTGREQIRDESKPLAGLSRFYRALNSRDMALMQQNWDSSDAAAMDNPLGGIKRGWTEIRGVYENLFRRGKSYEFEFIALSTAEKIFVDAANFGPATFNTPQRIVHSRGVAGVPVLLHKRHITGVQSPIKP